MLNKKLFPILIFLLPFSFALSHGNNIDLSLTRIVVPLFFLVWLIESLKNKRLLLDIRPRMMFFAIFLFLAFVSYFWAPDQTKALRKILFIGSFLPIYFVSFSVFQDQGYFWKSLKALFWSNLTIALLGIFQFVFQFFLGIDFLIKITEKSINPFFLGDNFAKSVSQYPSWLVNVGGNDLFRALAIFPDPHLFSLFLNLSLPLVLLLFTKTKKPHYLFGAGAMILASCLTFSRASFLALILALITSLFIFNFAQKLVQKPFFILPLIILISVIFLTNNPLRMRLFSSLNPSEGSISGRLQMWERATEITLENPFGGVGLGNFSSIVEPASNLRNPSYAHNLFLDFSSETGLISAIFLLLTLLSPVLFYFLKPQVIANKFILLSFLVLFVHCLFETPFYSVHAFPLILLLLSIDPRRIKL